MKKFFFAAFSALMLLSGCADNTVRETVSGDGGISEYGKSTFSSYRISSGNTPESTESSTVNIVESTVPEIIRSENLESIETVEPESSPSETVSEVGGAENLENPEAFEEYAETSQSWVTDTFSEESEPYTSEPSDSADDEKRKPLNYSEVKGIWISFIEISRMNTDSESAFRESIGAAYDKCAALGINTVYVHARSHGDAYYNSEYFPKTKYINGNFDALAVMVDEAHKRGLSFQAWINPFRCCAVTDIEREYGYPIYNWAGSEKKLVTVGGYYWLNPAYDDVIELIAKGAAEIVSNYDVDGLHIDDYFYPTTDESFDEEAFQSSSYDSLSEFRFDNCDRTVNAIYEAVKSANPDALFGISCQGSLENNYGLMYADVKKWCSDYGYTDYIMPQIYYGYENSAQPFERCAAEWDAIAQNGKIPLIVGLSVSKIGHEDEWAGDGRYEWIESNEILKRQFETAYGLTSYGGICLYSYNSVFSPDEEIASQVNEEINALMSIMNR